MEFLQILVFFSTVGFIVILVASVNFTANPPEVLMARNDDTFKENPAGVSSVLFYHATIIIHGRIQLDDLHPMYC